MTTVFKDSDYYTGPALTAAVIHQAEESLGVHLPERYVSLLHEKNGGILRQACFPTSFPTAWADNHFKIQAILGLGGHWGIDSNSGQGSADQIIEWGYPNIGVVFCDMPSAGHDAVMFDYSTCGPSGDPCVVYIGEDRTPRLIAENFEQFLSRLVSCKILE
jgi:hypothetical protein